MKVVAVPTILVVLLLILLGATPIHTLGDSVQWIKVSNSVVPTAVLYDIDADGRLEVVAPSFIIDESGVLPIAPVQVVKYDYDGDGRLDLILYSPASGQLVVFINSTSYVYSVPANSTVEVYSGGLRIGSKVVSHRMELAAPTDAKSFAPIYSGGALSLVYIDSNGRLIYYDQAKKWIIYTFTEDYTIIDAAMHRNEIHVALTVAAGGSSVLLSYSVDTGMILMKILGSNVTWGRFVGSKFVYRAGNTLYVYDLATRSISALDFYAIRVVYPVMDLHTLAVISPGAIRVYTNGTLVATYQAPPSTEVYSVDIEGGSVVAATSGGIYVGGKEVPTIKVYAPLSVYAGEPIPVNIIGDFDYAYVTVDGRRYDFWSNPLNITLSKPGTYSMTVTACKNLLCVSDTLQVTVKARTMTIKIAAPKSVEPYSQLEITISVIDSITGRLVEALCRVEVSGNEKYYTATGGTVNVSTVAVPVGTEVPIVVECSAPGYADAAASVSVPVSSYYYAVDLIYAGGGVFTIRAYNRYTGEPFNGTIEAAVDGRPAQVLGNRVTVPPGNHTLAVTLKKGEVVVGRYTWTITYYPDISQVPAGLHVVVGDRVQRETVTRTATVTTTRTVPMTVETANPFTLAGVFMLGLGLGVTILLLQRARTSRK